MFLKFMFKYQRCVVLCLVATFVFGFLVTFWTTYNKRQPHLDAITVDEPFDFDKWREQRQVVHERMNNYQQSEGPNLLDKIKKIAREGRKRTPAEEVSLPLTTDLPDPNYNVHVFYYGWYGNPDKNGKYYHWNHSYLSHWNAKEDKKWPKGSHLPPGDIGSNYYPELGPYSSKDVKVINNHMKQIRMAGIGVLAVSWYPPGDADEQGEPSDNLVPVLLDEAEKYKLKVCLHVEPYKGRNIVNMRINIKYALEKYGNHPAFYKTIHRGKSLPMFYIYDSYNLPSKEWKELLFDNGKSTIRGTPLDAMFIGLVVKKHDLDEMIPAGFDGFYTYFATDGFTFGSSQKNWNYMAQQAKLKNLVFIPSIGPGYNDTRVRAWNDINSRSRSNGNYYKTSFREAANIKPSIISITSFNEWHEGTQIERAMPKEHAGYKYLSYHPNSPDYYLQLTQQLIKKWKSSSNH